MYSILYHCLLHRSFCPIAIFSQLLSHNVFHSPHPPFKMRISPAEAKLLAYFNGTLPRGVYPNCTLRVDCLLTGYVTAQIDYYPSFDGNLLYLALFAIFLIAQIVQGIVWKTWSYSLAIILGLVLECLGYVGRLALSRNPFVFDSFLV